MSQADIEDNGMDLTVQADDTSDRKSRAARLTATRLGRADGTASQPHFSQPVRQVVLMLIVLTMVSAGGWFAYGRILPIFAANPLLNGAILLVFALGVLTCFWQVAQLINSVSWIERFAAGKLGYATQDQAPTHSAPRLLAPLAQLLGARGPVGTTITTESSRSILESVATRIDESRDITRYLANLLIFLGLLGTFYGLATTVPAIVETIRTLAPEQGDSGVEVFDKLMHGLETQLGGMATAFSSSLLGLAGSLVVGLLDLFSSHGQNRFYRELEEWLSSFTRIGISGGEAGLQEAHLIEFMTGIQMKLADLQDFYAGRDELRDQEASDADRRSLALAGGVERLMALIGSDRDALATELAAERQAQTESHRQLAAILERLSDRQEHLSDATTAATGMSARLGDLADGIEQSFQHLSEGQQQLIQLGREPRQVQLLDDLGPVLASISAGQERLAMMAQAPSPQLERGDHAALAHALDRLSAGQARLVELAEGRSAPHDDPEARMRLRSIDVQLGRLLEESASSRDGLITELREDIAALTRAIRVLDFRNGA